MVTCALLPIASPCRKSLTVLYVVFVLDFNRFWVTKSDQ